MLAKICAKLRVQTCVTLLVHPFLSREKSNQIYKFVWHLLSKYKVEDSKKNENQAADKFLNYWVTSLND